MQGRGKVLWREGFIMVLLCERCGKMSDKPHRCMHLGVPWVKSLYSDEMVKRGRCDDCGVSLLELD